MNKGGVVSAVAKFIKNSKNGESSIVSRTFGKVAFIDRDWQETVDGKLKMPAEEEFWFVDIVRDTGKGSNKGVLIVRPRFKLEPTEIARLMPGNFNVENADCLYVRPHHPGVYWIAGLALKEALFLEHGGNSLIVALEEPVNAIERGKTSIVTA